jgi:uridine kinase
MTPARRVVLDELTRWITGIDCPHPVRVALDGPDGAGKTTLADELAVRIAAERRAVIRASADDFGRPRADRYRRGHDSADGYRLDSFDHAALRRLLLDPLGAGGDRRYRTAAFDLEADLPIDAVPAVAAPDAVLLVDGVFLLQADLRDVWDCRVFVSVRPATALARALARDVPRLGDAAAVEARYRARYLPAQADYLASDRPSDAADFVLENDVPGRPRLLARPVPVDAAR